MNLNLEKARYLMVENQLRPNRIKDKKVLDLFNEIPKEKFIPEKYINICYADQDVDILSSRGYLKNLHLAQIISSSNIKKNDKVLHIGGLTGYFSVIISNLCNELYVIEEDENNYIELKKNIEDSNLINVNILKSDFKVGYPKKGPYDLIIIDCPLYNFKNNYFNQLKNNQGRLIYIKKLNNELSKAIKITKNNNNYSEEYLFDVFSNYSIDKKENEFKF